MENIYDALKLVLSTQLLAPSLSELAKTLGYGSRSTLYTIIDGSATANAVNKLYERLDEHLHIDEKLIYRMALVIENCRIFTRLIRKEANTDHPEWQFQMLLAFITDYYEYFSPHFRKEILNELLRFKGNEPDEFFNMLAYFYITASDIKFYKSRLTYFEQCRLIIEPLGQKLHDIFPENDAGKIMSQIYSLDTPLKYEAPILWNLVKSIGEMLQIFANPNATREKFDRMLLLPNLGDRSYMEGKNKSEVILMRATRSKQAGSGFYEVLSIRREDMAMRYICRLMFADEQFLTMIPANEINTHLGMYTLDEHGLTFDWEDNSNEPTGLGLKWKLLKLEQSQILRQINRSLDDDKITELIMESRGMKKIEGLGVKDVAISRNSVELRLENGDIYTIDRSEASFLEFITPDDIVTIVRMPSDNNIYAVWAEISHFIPLSNFTKR